jgi:homoaconitase/3-isopropylmalate dehydratase large subunit
MRYGFHAFDMALLAAEALASRSADTIVEFSGKPVEALTMDDRVTLVDIGAEAFRAGIIQADSVTSAFFAERVESPPPIQPARVRDGYAESVAVSLAGREPLVQGPGPGGPVRPVSDLAGKKIHSAYIGSCAAGRTSDLMIGAAILKRARKIHPDVRLTVSPATLEVARECLATGTYETFLQVGAMLAVPGSSPGMASGGALFGEGEVIISTAPYMSSMTDQGRGPEVYRASPATVAASAIAGEIRGPGGL